MGANSDEENEPDGERNSDDESEEIANGDAAPKDDASDSDSVASYQPHPDDLASDSDSEGDQDSNPEEDAEETARKAAYFAPIEDHPITDTQGTFDTMSLTRPILKALSS